MAGHGGGLHDVDAHRCQRARSQGGDTKGGPQEGSGHGAGRLRSWLEPCEGAVRIGTLGCDGHKEAISHIWRRNGEGGITDEVAPCAYPDGAPFYSASLRRCCRLMAWRDVTSECVRASMRVLRTYVNSMQDPVPMSRIRWQGGTRAPCGPHGQGLHVCVYVCMHGRHAYEAGQGSRWVGQGKVPDIYCWKRFTTLDEGSRFAPGPLSTNLLSSHSSTVVAQGRQQDFPAKWTREAVGRGCCALMNKS